MFTILYLIFLLFYYIFTGDNLTPEHLRGNAALLLPVSALVEIAIEIILITLFVEGDRQYIEFKNNRKRQYRSCPKIF